MPGFLFRSSGFLQLVYFLRQVVKIRCFFAIVAAVTKNWDTARRTLYTNVDFRELLVNQKQTGKIRWFFRKNTKNSVEDHLEFTAARGYLAFMNEYHELLLPGEYYHIYNRAVGNEKLFLKKDNYLFFLKKCEKYLSPICDTFSYCLLPNHFHLFIRIRELLKLEEYYALQKGKQISLSASDLASEFVVGQISNLCSGYAKAFNKVYSRKGRLFIDPFSRKIVKGASHFHTLVFYIHGNATHHGYCRNFEEWPYSSYHQFIGNGLQLPFKVARDEVLTWFGGIENFIMDHKAMNARKS